MDVLQPQKKGYIRSDSWPCCGPQSPFLSLAWWLLYQPGIHFILPPCHLTNRKVCSGELVLDHMLLPRLSYDFLCRDMNTCPFTPDLGNQ